MKKSLWGYDPKQVDELLTSLQNQNDLLTTKVTNLTIKLSDATQDGAAVQQLQQLKQQNEMLTQQMQEKQQAYDAKTKELTQQIKALLASGPVEQTLPANEKGQCNYEVGAICARAYQDMENMKYAVSDVLSGKVNEYAKTVQQSNAKMQQSLEAMKLSYDQMMDVFATNLEETFNHLNTINQQREVVQQSILPAEEIASQLKETIAQSLEESVFSQKEEEARLMQKYGLTLPQPEVSEPEQPVPVSPFDRLRQKIQKIEPGKKTAVQQDDLPNHIAGQHKKPEYALQDEESTVLGIQTNISADDVFGSTKAV